MKTLTEYINENKLNESNKTMNVFKDGSQKNTEYIDIDMQVKNGQRVYVRNTGSEFFTIFKSKNISNYCKEVLFLSDEDLEMVLNLEVGQMMRTRSGNTTITRIV